MHKVSIYLSILIAGLVGISSCQEVGQETIQAVQKGKIENRDPFGYENKLKELSLFMGEVFKDPEARRELFELANADEHKEDITYSLKTLLATNQNPMTRQRSAIANAFYKNSANHRTLGEEDFKVEELIKFINSNDITMLAPYMVGYFKPDEITELTVSYWTEDIEQKDIQNDPNGKGKTPGFKLKLNEDGNFIRFEQSESDLLKSEEVEASDDYAMKHPTIVFVNFEEENPKNDSNARKASFGDNISNRILNSPVCSDLKTNGQDIVTVRMPEIQLNDNIRRWPNHNYIFMWVATGSLEVGSDGLPKLASSVNHPISNLKVTRRDGNNKNWVSSNSSFIISNWKFDSENAYIVWGCTRTKAQVDVEGTVKASKKDGPSAEIKVKVAVQNSIELVSAMSYDKCFVMLNNRNQTPQGQPLRLGYPVYQFGQIRSYFTIEKLQ